MGTMAKTTKSGQNNLLRIASCNVKTTLNRKKNVMEDIQVEFELSEDFPSCWNRLGQLGLSSKIWMTRLNKGF
jgi:hypothetical protein